MTYFCYYAPKKPQTFKEMCQELVRISKRVNRLDRQSGIQQIDLTDVVLNHVSVHVYIC